jgi:hypothetical protein
MHLAEIYDLLVFAFSKKKHYKNPGAEFPRTAHISGDATEGDTLTQGLPPKRLFLL